MHRRLKQIGLVVGLMAAMLITQALIGYILFVRLQLGGVFEVVALFYFVWLIVAGFFGLRGRRQTDGDGPSGSGSG